MNTILSVCLLRGRWAHPVAQVLDAAVKAGIPAPVERGP
jgi:hypothetical protein